MHLPNFSGLLGGLAAAVVMRWLFRGIKLTIPPAADGTRTLRYHRAYAAVGWLCFLFFMALAIGVSFSKELPRIVWFCLVVFGFFALLSLVVVVMYHRCALAYDAGSARYSPLWGQAYRFTWSDVAAVRFSGTAQWWRLRLRDGRNVRVSTYMHGTFEFMQTVAEHTRLPFPAARLPDGRKITFGHS